MTMKCSYRCKARLFDDFALDAVEVVVVYGKNLW